MINGNPYAGLSAYELRNLPDHLGASELWEELEGSLTDIAFLEAKATAGLGFALAEDLKADCAHDDLDL